jgi:hypothetical protein
MMGSAPAGASTASAKPRPARRTAEQLLDARGVGRAHPGEHHVRMGHRFVDHATSMGSQRSHFGHGQVWQQERQSQQGVRPRARIGSPTRGTRRDSFPLVLFLHRSDLLPLLAGGLVLAVFDGVGLITAVLAGLGLPVVLPALFAVVTSVGLVLPNATTLALSGRPEQAGTASALLGVLQYLFGAVVAPLVGVFGAGTAVPMATLMCGLTPAGWRCSHCYGYERDTATW